MNIIVGQEAVKQAQEKYTVLELDTLLIQGVNDPVTAYCLVERVPIDQMSTMHQYIDLHHSLMENYRRRNWRYCEDALEHLMGKWGGELDSFYGELHSRITELKQTALPDDWTGFIDKT